MSPSRATIEKSERLACVEVGRARTFAVQGDNDLYMVTLIGESFHCTCPSTTICSHVLAARKTARKIDRRK